MANSITESLKDLLDDVRRFADLCSGVRLRSYQEAVAMAVVDSVLHQAGHTFVVMFPRQSGKNELQAQIQAYLLVRLSTMSAAEMVAISPTWKPQSQNAMKRLERVLKKNFVTKPTWAKELGYVYRIGSARVIFLSGSPETNIVGATASALLSVDEAQDIQIAKFDHDIAPMSASTNATRVFWGTAWTGRTLLARELRAAREAEQRDGIRRVFVIGAEQVGQEVSAYREFVAGQVARFGRQHVMVRTQYFSEEVDAEGGMFAPERIALMRGAHERQQAAAPGRVYALLLDVAGEDEGASGAAGEELAQLDNPGRDSTALTVVEVDLATLDDALIQAPTYRVMDRQQWLGVKHTSLYAQLLALAESWRARFVVVDATGVGAGLASFLSRARPDQLLPVTFSQSVKSELGWGFLGIVDGGRWREYAPLDAELLEQLEHCQFQIQPGPGKTMRWGVPDRTRSAATGRLVHDDLVLSAALAAILDKQDWSASGPTLIVPGRDPLRDMDEF